MVSKWQKSPKFSGGKLSQSHRKGRANDWAQIWSPTVGSQPVFETGGSNHLAPTAASTTPSLSEPMQMLLVSTALFPAESQSLSSRHFPGITVTNYKWPIGQNLPPSSTLKKKNASHLRPKKVATPALLLGPLKVQRGHVCMWRNESLQPGDVAWQALWQVEMFLPGQEDAFHYVKVLHEDISIGLGSEIPHCVSYSQLNSTFDSRWCSLQRKQGSGLTSTVKVSFRVTSSKTRRVRSDVLSCP